MNLKSFGIANFKAFGANLQTMPLKPLTLVFGPNSAGKSSLLQSFLWALEATTEGGTFNMRSSRKVAGKLDLGGFRSFLHGRDIEKKIEIEIQAGKTASGESIRIIYSIGIRTEADFRKILEQRRQAVSEIKEYDELKGKLGEAAWKLQEISGWIEDFSTERIETILATQEAFDERISELIQETESNGWPGGGEERMSGLKKLNRSELKHCYDEALPIYARIKTMANSVRSKAAEIYLETREELSRESSCGEPKPISCEVWLGSKLGFKAFRSLGENDLVIDFETFDQEAWRTFSEPSDCWVEALGFREGGFRAGTGFTSCDLVTSHQNITSKNRELFVKAYAWFREVNESLSEAAKSLIYIPPLRALPARQDLLGTVGQPPADPLLLAWQRLRDDQDLRSQVNEKLRLLTCSELEFSTRYYAGSSDVIEAFEELTQPRGGISVRIGNQIDFSAEEMVEGIRSMTGREMTPEEVENTYGDQPSFESLRDDNEQEAFALLEKHVLGKKPDDVLCDLKLREPHTGVFISPQDVGVGISQIAPVLIEATVRRDSLIVIEQPEIHVHPRLQAELGDMFIETALGENKNTFLLETHSEHLILRILRRIRETTEGDFSDWPEVLREACPNGIRPEDVAVLFVKPGVEGSEIMELPIDANGEFTCDWPGGFFEERLKEFF